MKRTTVYLDEDTLALLDLHRCFTGWSMSKTIRTMTHERFQKDARYYDAQGIKKPHASGGDGEAQGRPGEVSQGHGGPHE